MLLRTGQPAAGQTGYKPVLQLWDRITSCSDRLQTCPTCEPCFCAVPLPEFPRFAVLVVQHGIRLAALGDLFRFHVPLDPLADGQGDL